VLSLAADAPLPITTCAREVLGEDLPLDGRVTVERNERAVRAGVGLAAMTRPRSAGVNRTTPRIRLAEWLSVILRAIYSSRKAGIEDLPIGSPHARQLRAAR
jgi:hypothetical protein